MKWNCFYAYLVGICILASVGIILNVRLISSCSQLFVMLFIWLQNRLPQDVETSVKVVLPENITTDSSHLYYNEEIIMTEDDILSKPIHFWKDDWYS